MPRVRVIGCGNPDAGDDAAGLTAVERARPLLRADVEVVTAPTGSQVLDLLDDADAVLLVDAMRTADRSRDAGALIRVEAGPDGLPVDLRSSLSSHGLGLAEAVGIASALGTLPRIVFLGIEVADVVAGAGLSPAVAAAIPDLVDAIVLESSGGSDP